MPFLWGNRVFYESKRKKGTRKRGRTKKTKKEGLGPSEVAQRKNQENKQTKTNKEG